MKLVSIDSAARLYVFREGSGTSCYGFDVLDRKARAVGTWLAEQTENPDAARAARTWLDLLGEPGTPDHFEVCGNIMERAQIHCSVFQVRCAVDTAPALRGLEGWRVSALVNGERRRFIVGISTGWLPCHVARHNVRSRGGDGLSAGDTITDVRKLDRP